MGGKSPRPYRLTSRFDPRTGGRDPRLASPSTMRCHHQPVARRPGNHGGVVPGLGQPATKKRANDSDSASRWTGSRLDSAVPHPDPAHAARNTETHIATNIGCKGDRGKRRDPRPRTIAPLFSMRWLRSASSHLDMPLTPQIGCNPRRRSGGCRSLFLPGPRQSSRCKRNANATHENR